MIRALRERLLSPSGIRHAIDTALVRVRNAALPGGGGTSKFYSRAEMGSNVSGKQGFTQTRKTPSSSYSAREDHRTHRRLSYHRIIAALQDTIQLDRKRLLVMIDGDNYATPQSRFEVSF